MSTRSSPGPKICLKDSDLVRKFQTLGQAAQNFAKILTQDHCEGLCDAFELFHDTLVAVYDENFEDAVGWITSGEVEETFRARLDIVVHQAISGQLLSSITEKWEISLSDVYAIFGTCCSDQTFLDPLWQFAQTGSLLSNALAIMKHPRHKRRTGTDISVFSASKQWQPCDAKALLPGANDSEDGRPTDRPDLLERKHNESTPTRRAVNRSDVGTGARKRRKTIIPISSASEDETNTKECFQEQDLRSKVVSGSSIHLILHTFNPDPGRWYIADTGAISPDDPTKQTALKGLADTHSIVFPINHVQLGHWTLVLVDTLAQTIETYDPLPSETCYTRSLDAVRAALRYKSSPCGFDDLTDLGRNKHLPRQGAGTVDCGIYVLAFAIYRMHSTTIPPFFEPDVFRRCIAAAETRRKLQGPPIMNLPELVLPANGVEDLVKLLESIQSHYTRVDALGQQSEFLVEVALDLLDADAVSRRQHLGQAGEQYSDLTKRNERPPDATPSKAIDKHSMTFSKPVTETTLSALRRRNFIFLAVIEQYALDGKVYATSKNHLTSLWNQTNKKITEELHNIGKRIQAASLG